VIFFLSLSLCVFSGPVYNNPQWAALLAGLGGRGEAMQSGTSGASSFFVYAWGRGDLGQLGVGDDNNHNSPTLVATLANKKIVRVAAGDYHTAFLTSW
jgi:hypothetical protein